jgi:competence protein ComEC
MAHYGKKTEKIVQLAAQFQLDNRLDGMHFQQLHNSYEDLLVVDSLGIYKGVLPHKIVLLRQNPSIHLDDLIEQLKPQIIIADGSNYPSFVGRWKATCEARNTRFHSTATAGSYPLN